MNDSKAVQTIQNHKQKSLKLLMVFMLSDHHYQVERSKRRREQGWLALDHCLKFLIHQRVNFSLDYFKVSFLVSIIESTIYTAVYSSSYIYPSRKLFKSIIDLAASPHTHPLRLTIFRATKFLLLDVRGFLRPRPNVELFMRRTEPNSNLVCSSHEKIRRLAQT